MTSSDDPLIPPPGNDAAEQSVLGSMLRDNHAIADVLQVLRPSHFRTTRHQQLFALIAATYDRQKAVDLITLGEELTRLKLVEDLGPARLAYLSDLWDAAPTSANVLHYASIVREHAIIRSLFFAGQEIAGDAKAHAASADDLLEEAERRIFEIAEAGVTGQAVQLREVITEALRLLEARVQVSKQGSAAGGLPTGFLDLDNLLSGGLPPGALVVIGARPSIGKTAIGLSIAKNVTLRGEPALFISLEQSRYELADRLLANQAEVNSYDIRSGDLDTPAIQKILAAGSALKEAFLFLDDSPGQTMLRIAANARRMKLRHNIALVVVDYLQLIEVDGGRRDNRQEAVSEISRRLKALARELNVPVIALAQLNREVERRGADAKPKLSDLRESGSIEADADIAMLLHREGDGDDTQGNKIEVIVAKNRNGPTGAVDLLFQKQFVRFTNLARGVPQF